MNEYQSRNENNFFLRDLMCDFFFLSTALCGLSITKINEWSPQMPFFTGLCGLLQLWPVVLARRKTILLVSLNKVEIFPKLQSDKCKRSTVFPCWAAVKGRRHEGEIELWKVRTAEIGSGDEGSDKALLHFSSLETPAAERWCQYF